MRLALSALVALSAAACLNQPTSGALVQQTAHELNLNLRFGRMELASENVGPTYKEKFVQAHEAWGGQVRVADTELDGLQLTGKEDALVAVRFAWFRVDEGDLRTTVVRQKWHDYKGTWMLDGEERATGDIGLLGEKVEVLAPEGGQRPAQFPTVRIGAVD